MSRESKEFTKVTDIKRSPRRWIAFWLYGIYEAEDLLTRTEELVIEKFPQVLDVKLQDGLLYLKIAGGVGDLSALLCSLPNVGGLVEGDGRMRNIKAIGDS